MIEQKSQSEQDSAMMKSLANFKRAEQAKLKPYENNIENYLKNRKYGLQKIDPKGISSNGIYCSFSGAIESAQIYSSTISDLQLLYEIKLGDEWHDETPDYNDTYGRSAFCEAKNGRIAFSLTFDALASCMYIETWPQMVIKCKGFNSFGEHVTKGYAQFFMPTQPGQYIRQAYIYAIVRHEKWYHSIFPFWEPQVAQFDDKEFEQMVAQGEGRQMEKIKTIGKLKIRVEVLFRNYLKFGYK